ncbi:MAG TPA: TetR/AcrR family transcriptional regulator [Ktedonobacterales bacterium]
MSNNPQSTGEHNARGRLLREGLRLFLHQGFAAVSTRQICVAAGVTQPSLYHHFGNKEGLYLAAIEEWLDSLRLAMTEALAQGATFQERLHHLAIFFWSGQAGEYQAMQHDAMLHLPRESIQSLRGAIFTSVIDPLLSVMLEGIASGELPAHSNPYALMELYWAIVDGFTGLYHRGDALPTPEHNTTAVDLFLAGARALPAESFAAWPTMERLDAFRRVALQWDDAKQPGAQPAD